MAINKDKLNVSLGSSRTKNFQNLNTNFDRLFDNDQLLEDKVDGKEPLITSKKTAFNQNFETNSANVKMNGVASAGSSNNVARADHIHPHDLDKQDAMPDGTNLLIKDGKLNLKFMPDEIMGQLSYKGTYSPASIMSGTGITAHLGDYYIANTTGRYNPDGSDTGDNYYYNTGDWSVYNGTGWDKVDNTDAVTLVNGQKGNVNTYKGEWQPGEQGYKGDTVSYQGVLYLLTADLLVTPGDTPVANELYVAYGITTTATDTADGLMSKDDKIILKSCDDDKHTHANKALLDSYKQTEANIAAAVSSKHTHTNKSILDSTTAIFDVTDQKDIDASRVRYKNITAASWTYLMTVDGITYFAYPIVHDTQIIGESNNPFVPLRAVKTSAYNISRVPSSNMLQAPESLTVVEEEASVSFTYAKDSVNTAILYMLSSEKFVGKLYYMELRSN